MAGERTVKIKFDGTTSGLATAAAKARAELKAVEKQTESNKKSLAGFASNVGGIVAKVAQFALMLSTLASGLGIVVALAGAIGALSGVAGLLPAAAFMAAGALAAVKLGADGIKRAFDALDPTLNTLKAQVSATFEKSFKPAVKDIGQILPQLSPGLQRIATEIGGAASRVTSLINTKAGIGFLKTILDSTAVAIHNIGAFLAPVIAAFLHIGAVAAPMLAAMTAGLGNVGERFKAFVDAAASDGRLQAWIQTGIDMLRQLGAFIGDVFGIVKAVFTALDAAGVGLGGTLGIVVHQIRQFLESAQGQEVLRSLATALATVGQVVGTVLHAALIALAPVLPPLLDAFAQLATQLGPVLTGAIGLLAPVLAGLASFLAANMAWLGPILITVAGLAGVIFTVIEAIKLWQKVVLAYTIVQWLLNAAMSANPLGLVIIAIAALIAIIILVVTHLDFFRGIWDTVWKWCSDRVTDVATFFRNLWETVIGWLGARIQDIGGFFAGVWRWVTDAATSAANWIRGIWEGAGNWIRGVFASIGNFAAGVWNGIVGAAKSALNGVIRVVNGAISGINAVTGVVGIPSIPHIPMLAKGGTAVGGRSYLVGERGPELFTPGRTGRVTNADTTADALGGGGVPEIHIYIGDRELTDLVRVEIKESNRGIRRAVTAGAGAAA